MTVLVVLLALGLLMLVAYRGYSVILFAPACAMLAVLLTEPRAVPAAFTGVFMEKMVVFIQHVANVDEFPPERWEAVLAVNLSAAFYAVRAALPLMKSKNWGRIINIASVHGLVASAGKAAYVAAKHGLIGLTKVIALEITCNAICPGWVDTLLVRRQIDARAAREGVSTEEAKSRLLAEKQPSLEFATPEQIGDLVVFLCSPAADQMRGAALNIDGGWLAH